MPNLDKAMVHASKWTQTFSDDDHYLAFSDLEYFINRLEEDFYIPKTELLSCARKYTYADAEDWFDYWLTKKNLLVAANVMNESEQYYKIRDSLPLKWRQHVPLSRTLNSLRAKIQQYAVTCGWPKVKEVTTEIKTQVPTGSFAKKSDATSALGKSKSKSSSGKTTAKDGPPPGECYICKKLGKPKKMH